MGMTIQEAKDLEQSIIQKYWRKSDDGPRAEPKQSAVQVLTNPTKSDIMDSRDYSDIISEAAKRYNVPEKLIRKVIQVESGGNPKAKSSAGALGLMQLMPATAGQLGVTDPLNPRENILGGTKYIAQLYNQFGTYIDALWAYNAGPGNRNKGIKPAETKNYLKKIFGD